MMRTKVDVGGNSWGRLLVSDKIINQGECKTIRRRIRRVVERSVAKTTKFREQAITNSVVKSGKTSHNSNME